ncbi:FmdB family transcriptional regulator [Deinococcus sp. Arct2-2]|uniref:FmdB family zinc ribbon protein n=1 Tax=Deinococcus sp. Arct2-2 TaxID=2568653 RepID=UPI0010A4476A|nr:FmdB family transcriptional regulator [Deinococcus sp. Arct2-2]
MPTYLYKNTLTGEVYELRQSMRDDAYTTHPETGVAVKRILARPSIAFKGSGFYVNDSRPAANGDSGGGSSSGSSSSSSGSSGSSDGGSKGKSGGE